MKLEIDELLNDITRARARLLDKIASLPLNISGVTQVNDRCVIVRSSALVDGRLSSRYYITKSTRKVLLDVVQCTPIESLPDRIEGIIENGEVRGQRIHPDIVAALQSAWIGCMA